MAYSKQTFADGQKLTADHMNHIESGLEALDTGKLNASELSSAINTALAQAAASGDFGGKDGAGISSIARTSGSGAAGTTDTYTITLTDGSSYTFTVYNGADGEGGSGGTGGAGVSDAEIDESGRLIITLTDGSTIDAGVAKGDTGASGARGSKWYTGTAITGVSTSGTVFSGSGISYAAVGDMYLNSSIHRIYECVQGGAPDTARWAYVCYIKGAVGATGAAGADSISSANINTNGYLILTLSDGDTINAGLAKGEDGYSPLVTVSAISGGYNIEIKSLDSGLEKVEGFPLYHGEDGYTPVRGTDYWTAEDIAAIKSYVDDAILGGSW